MSRALRAACACAVLVAAGVSSSAAESSPASAAPPPLVVRADDGPLHAVLSATPARPALGAPVSITLTAQLDAGTAADLRWPDVRSELTKALGTDVVEVETVRTRPDGGGVELVLRLFDQGEHALPPLDVRAIATGADAAAPPLASARLDGVVLRVDAGVGDDVALAATRGAVAWAAPARPFPWALAGAAAAVLAALAAAVLLLARRRAATPPTAPPPVPPHERALAALEALLARELPEHGRFDPYFVELSEIVRRYLEERFALRAPEQTTEEFLASIMRSETGRRTLEPAHRELLRAFLVRADLVKFARAVPDVRECGRAASDVERFVVETQPEAPQPDDVEEIVA